MAGDRGFRDQFRAAKRTAKLRLADWIKATTGHAVDPDSIFDAQVKRIHEYKRQLLNVLRIVVLYNRLRDNSGLHMPPRTFLFAGKAAPAYRLAKLIIKLINNLAGTIDGDPTIRGRLKVLFLPEYDVSLAERLIPASDVSNQISTAGFEASGTSNMKFMMNGALTIGTRDGATIEMAEEAGEDNFFLFGLTADQVAGSRAWYDPHWHYDHDPETRAALDLIFSDSIQPQRARCLWTAPRYAAHPRRLLHASGGPAGLSRRRSAPLRPLRGSGCVGGQGHHQRRTLGHLLQRPDDRGICGGHLEREALPGGLRTHGMAALSPLAGNPAPDSILVDVPRLITAYYAQRPVPSVAAQRVVFGTSGHRGSSLDGAFNEAHILAITQAICRYRALHDIDGPLFIGMDTHALSQPAFATALEVLAANGVEVMTDAGGQCTPTPVISHAILTYNRGRRRGLADGIVITPSHNPPQHGGFKYDPPEGGPADTHVTEWIENHANALLAADLREVRRIPYERARKAPTTHPYDYIDAYVSELPSVVDLDAIRSSTLRIGVDPLGGASLAYWEAIGNVYGLNLEIVNTAIDPTFRFMTVDADGQIRMDPSSPYAMARLVALKDRFDVCFASDPDADRHGIVSGSAGLLEPNHYLSVAIAYLFVNRPQWPNTVGVGKTVVTTSLIDRVTASLGRPLIEVPVGFKWFVDGLIHGSIGFCGEESSGATFLRRDGTVWTTDKDGLVPNLLAAEITARTGKDPGEHYRALTARLGTPYYTRIDAPASAEQKATLQRLSPEDLTATELAGEPITAKLSRAPGNNAPLGGVKIAAPSGWFAARPSGTESIVKIYAESFRSQQHLETIIGEAQSIVGSALGASRPAAAPSHEAAS